MFTGKQEVYIGPGGKACKKALKEKPRDSTLQLIVKTPMTNYCLNCYIIGRMGDDGYLLKTTECSILELQISKECETTKFLGNKIFIYYPKKRTIIPYSIN